MNDLKHTSINTLLLLTAVVLVSGCNNSQDFFPKTDLESMEMAKAMPAVVGGSEVVGTPVNEEDTTPAIKDDICVADPKACDLKPVVTKAGVVTMLLAFGDLMNDELVITEGSARLLAQNSVKYASPVVQPKILVVKDYNNQGESQYDTTYIATVLLANYNNVDVLNETSNGLTASDLEGYDLVWFNNPGHAMGNKKTMITLMEFKGGVILSGDDLTQGNGFSLEPLTGLKFVDNGAYSSCNGKSYTYDNNGGYRYKVEISSQFLPGISNELRSFEYGNDIDLSVESISATRNLEVLAYAEGECASKRPVIVRYEK